MQIKVVREQAQKKLENKKPAKDVRIRERVRQIHLKSTLLSR